MGDSGDDIVVSTVVTGDGMGGGSCAGRSDHELIEGTYRR